MVDKKLSEFEAIEKSDDIDLVVLYKDNQNTVNGKLSITKLDDVYATKTELAKKSSFKLFHHDWFDYQLNDQSWLRADAFSWQDGTVYSEAYNHLVNDYENNLVERHYIETVGIVKYRTPSEDSLSSLHPYAWGGTQFPYYTDTENPTTSDKSYGSPNADSQSGYYITDVGSTYEYSETIGSYTITYYLSSDGHKIILPDQEDIAQNIYNESGVAWYYILDTTNQRFKLPRELPITDKSKGNGIALGLTDGNTQTGLRWSTSVALSADINSYGQDVGGTTGGFSYGVDEALGITTDSTKSGIISHRANENGQQYLYFYVGQFSQSAIEQTAGLNSELFNGKVDLNLNNMNPSATAKETIVGWGMPDYSAGVSKQTGVDNIAECDGMIAGDSGVFISATFHVYINNVEYKAGTAGPVYGNSGSCFIFVNKGDTYKTNMGTLTFYPLKGV